MEVLIQYRKVWKIISHVPANVAKFIKGWYGDNLDNLTKIYISYINSLLVGVLSGTINVAQDNVFKIYKALGTIDRKYPIPDDLVISPLLRYLHRLEFDMDECYQEMYVKAAFTLRVYQEPLVGVTSSIKLLNTLIDTPNSYWHFYCQLYRFYNDGNGLGFLLLRLRLIDATEDDVIKLNDLIAQFRHLNWDVNSCFKVLVKANDGFLNGRLNDIREISILQTKRNKRKRFIKKCIICACTVICSIILIELADYLTLNW